MTSGVVIETSSRSESSDEKYRWAVEEHVGSNTCTGKRTSWFRGRVAVGIRCTGSGDFSDGFAKKTNAYTKKRMGSATWKAPQKGKSFAKSPGEEES